MKILKISACLILFIASISTLIPIDAIAQPTGSGPQPPAPIPITGIEWLLLGGGLFGAKKIYDYRRKKNI